MRKPLLALGSWLLAKATACRLAGWLMLAIVALGITSGLAAPTPAKSQEPRAKSRLSAWRLLERSVRAADRVAFSGRQVTVLWQNGVTDATITEEYHSGTGQMRIETLMPPRARGRIVVDDGRHRWQYEPSRRTVLRSPSVPAEPVADLGRLRENYVATRLPQGTRVADCWTDVVELTPRVLGKPARRLWIDRETGLVLRVEKFHADGSHLSASHFTEVQVGPRPPARLFEAPAPPGASVVSVESPETAFSLDNIRARFHVPLPASLPGGYRFIGGRLISRGGSVMAHLRYDDGLNPVSLYIARAGDLPHDPNEGEPVAPLTDGEGQVSAAHHLNALAWRSAPAAGRSPLDCALVGDVSPGLLRQVARGTGLSAENRRLALGPRSGGVLIGGLALLLLAGLLAWKRRRWPACGRSTQHAARSTQRE
jgi:outer membrane lipoprotein-sorting protein